MKFSTHMILQGLAMIVQALNFFGKIAPPHAQPYVLFSVTVIQAGLAAYAHYFNPDGTSAKVAYVKPSAKVV